MLYFFLPIITELQPRLEGMGSQNLLGIEPLLVMHVHPRMCSVVMTHEGAQRK
jgi:hypothetical protein